LFIIPQAQAYERDGNEEKAFEYYYLHAILVMKKLAKHPEVVALGQVFGSKVKTTSEERELWAGWKKAKQTVESNLPTLESLKPSIRQRFEAYQKRRDDSAHVQAESERSSLTGSAHRMNAGLYNRTKQLDPSLNSDYAVKLAHNEFRGAGLREGEPQQKPSLQHRGTFFNDDSEEDISAQIKAAGERREQAFAPQQDLPPTSGQWQQQQQQQQQQEQSNPPGFQYPSVPKQTETKNESSWYGNTRDFGPSVDKVPPTKPPKELIESSSPIPPVPAKIQEPEPVEAPDTAVMDPRKYTFMTAATTEDGRPLRTLFINPKLRSRFLTIALANTQRNLETCGILCGKLLSNAFFVSKLVIPEQESTSDTCDTVNEGALFDYCDKEDLMTLGWIHTHPTQTCFMSSRDLHTHGGYQVQLPESIAIVCAPRHEPSYVCNPSKIWLHN
jgi:STAM-binding protein